MGIRLFLLAVGSLFIGETAFSQLSWKELHSIEDLYSFDPDILTYTLEQVNLDYPGLENVKASYSEGNHVEAASQLLDYYRENKSGEDFRREVPATSDRRISEADTILNNVFDVQNVKGKVPYHEDGHRDWYYKGPNNDKEWAWLSNRHTQLNNVVSAYYETGNSDYVEYVDLFLKDFILASMPYPAKKGSESIWRGLEVAARAKVWTRLFYGLINNPDLSDASKFLILRGFPDHAHYNRNFHGRNNWLTMEISALATVAAYFPEYKMSPEWMDYTVDVMIESMRDQVYADGVQTELTSHYHNVSLRNFELYQKLCEVAGRDLPDYFGNTIEQMYAYIASAIRPDGYRMLNNDGDRGSDRAIIRGGAAKFNRSDWEYVITNGSSGTKPVDGPSYFYPWAGQLISRSDFGKDAHWSFFDIGPWGSGHQHNDKLHLSVAAFGRDLLVDAGRFAYTGAIAQKYRGYARSTAGHNSVLIDGVGQLPGPTHAKEPISSNYYKITDEYDYASHSFDQYDLEASVKHTRAMVYIRDQFWIVADRIETDKKRDVTTLWHWHPDCKVELSDKISKTVHNKGNLAVIPVGIKKLNVEMVKGQEQPYLQGWYSPEYNIYGPNKAMLYASKIKKPTNQVWLLLPSSGLTPEVQTKVIAQSANEVTVSVSLGEDSWKVIVPFEDSSKVSVSKS